MRRWLAAVTALAVLSGCGSSSEPEAAPPAGPAATEGAPAREPAGDDPPLDVCQLLRAEEVTEIIGANDGGRGGDGGCTWENPETYHSVTVTIGRTGTAPGGQLPAESNFGETEPGPDGIRFAQGNVVEFAVDDRFCDIQVVTSVTTEIDRPTAVRLVGLIRDRV
ncbi:DUF3558 family protein [Phytohabitans kaempferiae]|uniref:DUF3558 family protein n=1 Tax=Phytohabitans kaempferiae TaxID=1620943 RepID=A0ABV6MAY7_9ACTN